MAGESRIKNRRGELQRVLSREESYVDGKLSRAAFISIAILTFITFVGNFTQLQLSSALPIIVSEFHISVTTGQWLTSVFQLVMGVMVPLTAFLTRRFSTRQIVICSMAVFTVGSLLAWLGPNFVWVLVGRVLEAAGTGVMWPVLQITVFSKFTVLPAVPTRLCYGHRGHGHERGSGNRPHLGRLADRRQWLAFHLPDHDYHWRGLAGGGHVRTA